MKKTILALTLCMCLLLSSCWMPTLYDRIEEMEQLLEEYEQSARPTEEQPSTYQPNDSQDTEQGEKEPEETKPHSDNVLHEYIPYEDYERLYEPFEEEVPFSRIRYTRPDVKALTQAYADIQAMVEAEEDVDKIVEAYEAVFEAQTYFETMHTYAYIRYSLDLNDTYYDTEYNWCEEQSPIISQAEEKCFVAMAESPLREDLEEAYFEEGFFEFYDENRIYSKDEVVALMQKESDLQSQYMELQSDMTVTWKGREESVDELLEDESLSYTEYLQVYQA